MVEICRRVLKDNGCTDDIAGPAMGNTAQPGEPVCVHESDARELRLTPRFDIVVAELMDHTGPGEMIHELLPLARTRWLKPGGQVIPDRIELHAFLLEWKLPDLPGGVDLSVLEPWLAGARHWPGCCCWQQGAAHLADCEGWRRLTDVVEFMDFQFNAASPPPRERHLQSVRFVVERPGVANAIAWFFVVHLDAEERICTAPVLEDFARFSPQPTCWNQALQSLAPVPVESGETLTLEVSHCQNAIMWRLSDEVSRLAADRLGTAVQARGVEPSVAQRHGEWFKDRHAQGSRVVKDKVRAVRSLFSTAKSGGIEGMELAMRLCSQPGELGASPPMTDRLLGTLLGGYSAATAPPGMADSAPS